MIQIIFFFAHLVKLRPLIFEQAKQNKWSMTKKASKAKIFNVIKSNILPINLLAPSLNFKFNINYFIWLYDTGIIDTNQKTHFIYDF